MEDKLIMSARELKRKTVMESVKKGHITLKEGSERLSVSYRQTLRIYKRFLTEGDAGLIHKSRGQSTSHKYPLEYKQKIIDRYQERYWDFGPTFASEKLTQEGLPIHPETLRLWLKEAGLWSRKRKRKPYHKKRPARLRFGELIQIDGSDHDWFETGETRACLLDMVDDATKTTFALMDDGETTQILLTSLKCWIEKYGIPLSVYVDKKSVFISPTHMRYGLEEAELRGQLSEFVRICKKLDIEVIMAHSAPAKGRVERKHGIYQDRFVKELRLRGIKSIDEANRYLKEEFLEEINHKFSTYTEKVEDAHRDPSAYGDLNQIFCWEETRCVAKDYTVRYENQYYQLQETVLLHVKPGQEVIVRRHLNNSVSIWRNEAQLDYEIIEGSMKKAVEPRKLATLAKRGSSKPKPNHPWRNQFQGTWMSFRKNHKKGQTAA
jgi:transposase